MLNQIVLKKNQFIPQKSFFRCIKKKGLNTVYSD